MHDNPIYHAGASHNVTKNGVAHLQFVRVNQACHANLVLVFLCFGYAATATQAAFTPK
jgi:hypothetical protein